MQTVLFTASSAAHIAAFHRPYLGAFRELGWRVHVACGGGELPLPEADEVVYLPFEKRMTAPANLRAQRELRRLMETYRYDLICTHTSLAAFFTRRAVAGLSARPPVINVAHGYLFHEQTPGPKRAILLEAEKLTARQTDLLLTMNEYDHAIACREHLGRRVEKIPGIGVDFTRLTRPPQEKLDALRVSYGFGRSDFVLLYAAEFSGRKNQPLLLRAMQDLPPRVKLLLPGSGGGLANCRALAETLGLADRVVFPGQVREMGPLYALADAAVTASWSEGLPFNVMEAMYCGLPVVASRVKGHTDLVEDGVTGLLYPPGDAPAFARRVLELLGDEALAAALGARAAAATKPYGLETVLPQVMAWYLSVLESTMP